MEETGCDVIGLVWRKDKSKSNKETKSQSKTYNVIINLVAQL